MSSPARSLSLACNAVALLLLAGGVHAADILVPADYSTIQAAINAASPGDTIRISAGTYRESILWTNKDLIIQGAGADETIIDPSQAGGGPGGACIRTQGLTDQSRLEGVKLTRGEGLFVYTPWGEPSLTDPGSGMRNVDSSLAIVSCAFVENVASSDDGNGVYNDGGAIHNTRSNVSVSSCTFRNNHGQQRDAIFNIDSSVTVTDSSFDDGSIRSYGSSLLVVGCTFSNMYGSPGAIASFRSQPTVINCTFRDLRIRGIYSENSFAPGVIVTDCEFNACSTGMESWYSPTTLTNCRFVGNVADQYSGFMSYGGTAVVTNCLFADNFNRQTDLSRLVDAYGGAISNRGGSLTVNNCTVVNNRGSWSGAGISTWGGTTTITNCIVWGNRSLTSGDADEIDALFGNGTMSVSFSNVERAAVYPGAGNIAAEPQFADPQTGDFRLMSGSPGVDAGNTSVVSVPPFPTVNEIIVDLNRAPRIVGNGIDMGAFELQPACFGDFNHDGGIDGADVGAFFADWEMGGSEADVNEDGGVDGADVSTFFAAWEAGSCR